MSAERLEETLQISTRRRTPRKNAQPTLTPPSGIALKREAEVLGRARALGLQGPITAYTQYPGDGQRPTALANTNEDRRQVLAISRMMCHAVSEALVGHRAVQQLRRWLSPEVYAKVCERRELLQRAALSQGVEPPLPALTVRTMRASQLQPSVWETCVVFHDGQRVRACAMRVDAHRGHWRICALELG